MASEHDCLEPELQRFINHNSSAEETNTPSKEDLDNLFSPIVSFRLLQLLWTKKEAPPIVTTSDEQTSPISLTEADEFNQEDFAHSDGNLQFVSYTPPSSEEIDSSTMALEPSNVQNFHQFIQISPWPIQSQSQYAIEVVKNIGLDEWLMYLTASRPDIAFATFVCARYQARPTVKHLKEVKRIFRYLRQSYNMGLWYPKDSGFELIAYSDADHAGCKDDCNKHISDCKFLGETHPTAGIVIYKLLTKERFEYLVHRIGRHKDKVGMQIPDWMITEEMKHTEHYKMFVEVFGLDVPLTRSSAPKRSTMIHFRSLKGRSTRLLHQLLVPILIKAYEIDLTFYLLGMMNQSFTALEEDEITDEVYELKRRAEREIGSGVWIHNFPTTKYDILERFLSRKSFDTLVDHLQEVMVESLPIMVDTHIKEHVKKEIPEQKAIDNQIPSQVDASVRSYMSGHILYVHPAQSQTLYMKFENLQVPQTTCRPSVVHPRDQDDPHDDVYPEGENSNQEQVDDYDFCIDSYASDDDEIPTKQVSQDIIEEVSLTVDEAKLKKMADEMLRQRCTSRDEHQYHINQMKNFLKSDIVWESRKEILVSPHLRKTTPLVLSCQLDPEAPALSLINQDLLDPHGEIFYLKRQKILENTMDQTMLESGLLWSLSVFIRSSVIWERVHDFQLGIESYQHKVNLTAPTISFPGVEKHKMLLNHFGRAGIISRIARREKGDETFRDS
ncbi:hypothetical protein Tco_0185777 [Tanacetum coccineum]